MTQQVFVLHGGDAFNSYEEYLVYLENKEVNLERAKIRDWKSKLEETLGDRFEVIAPRMPNGQNAHYEEWKIWFEKHIPFLRDGIILIGHSLGGIFLAKYLSEELFPKKIRATFLIAAPRNKSAADGGASFTLLGGLSRFADQGGEIFLYHSKDDHIVPFVAAELYQTELPKAQCRFFEDKQHFNQEEFPELVEEIQTLSS